MRAGTSHITFCSDLQLVNRKKRVQSLFFKLLGPISIFKKMLGHCAKYQLNRTETESNDLQILFVLTFFGIRVHVYKEMNQKENCLETIRF